MNYGVCQLSVIPLRSEAKDQAEIVSQLLLGDLVEILIVDDNWTKIRCLNDDYLGWMDTKQISTLSPDEFDQIQSSEKKFSKSHFTKIKRKNTDGVAPFGSTFYNLDNSVLEYSLDSRINNSRLKSISDAALSFLNAPYLWGGKTIYGIDCSGFTQIVFKTFGIQLKRDASQQVEQGESIAFEDTHENDLAFFSNKKGKVIHVGIVLKESKIIHASGQVRIDELNNNGIRNSESGTLTHGLHSIRRYQGVLKE